MRPIVSRLVDHLATANWSARRLDDAMTLYEQKLADRMRILGIGHWNSLASSDEIGLSSFALTPQGSRLTSNPPDYGVNRV